MLLQRHRDYKVPKRWPAEFHTIRYWDFGKMMSSRMTLPIYGYEADYRHPFWRLIMR